MVLDERLLWLRLLQRPAKRRAKPLLVGLDAQAKALSVQGERFAAQIEAFSQQVGQLGPQAFAGGKAGSQPEVRAAFQGAASVVGVAAEAVTTPAQKTMTASLDALDRAQLA